MAVSRPRRRSSMVEVPTDRSLPVAARRGSSAALEQVAEATGVTVSAHDLRRTFITVAESTDISPLALKALVNHSLGNDVTSGYVIATAERLREPAQRVADRLRAICGVPATPDGIAKAG